MEGVHVNRTGSSSDSRPCIPCDLIGSAWDSRVLAVTIQGRLNKQHATNLEFRM
jgi:hypothetical protein